MKVKVQVVTITDNGEESMREVACVERADLTPASLGVAIADSKAILQGIQEVVVAWQMHEYLNAQRSCPDCGKLRHSKGSHHTVFRTVFGDVPVESPQVHPLSLSGPCHREFQPAGRALAGADHPRVALLGDFCISPRKGIFQLRQPG